MRRRADQPADTIEQRAARRRQDEGAGIGAQFLEVGKRLCVGVWVTTEAHGKVVAAVLAFDADAPRQPPDSGVVEEQRFDERLHEVHEVVVTPDVRQLMRENRLELLGSHPGHRAHGHEDDWAQPSDHRGHLYQRGFEDSNRPRNVQALREPGGNLFPGRGRGHRTMRAQALYPRPAGQQAKRQESHARKPGEKHHAHPRLIPAGGRSARIGKRFGHGRRRGLGQWRNSHAPTARRHRHRRGRRGTVLGDGLRHRAPRLKCRDHRHREHQRQTDGGHDVADVSGAAPQRKKSGCREQAHECPLPDELEQRPPNRLRRRLLKQVLNRDHHAPPDHCPFQFLSRSPCRPRASGESPPARQTRRACWRAPAGRASMKNRRRRGPSGRG